MRRVKIISRVKIMIRVKIKKIRLNKILRHIKILKRKIMRNNKINNKITNKTLLYLIILLKNYMILNKKLIGKKKANSYTLGIKKHVEVVGHLVL